MSQWRIPHHWLLCRLGSLVAFDDHQRPHHVVFLVFQDVAVPHVLIAASPRAGWRRHDTALAVLICGTANCMMMRVTVPGNIITVSFQPVSFGWAGVPEPMKEVSCLMLMFLLAPRRCFAEAGSVEWLPADELHVHQVEVHRVNIRRQVENLPHLDVPIRDRFGDRTLVGAAQSSTGRAGRHQRAEHLNEPTISVERLVQ